MLLADLCLREVIWFDLVGFLASLFCVPVVCVLVVCCGCCDCSLAPVYFGWFFPVGNRLLHCQSQYVGGLAVVQAE